MNPYSPQDRPFQQRPVFQPPIQQRQMFRPPVQQRPVFSTPVEPTPIHQSRARRIQHPALTIAFGVLVAALVITTVMLVRGTSTPQPTASPRTPPTPPVVLSTTSKVPTTTEPTTTEPSTTEPTTTKPSTTKPPKHAGGEAVVIRRASAAASAWAAAVSTGDAAGVLAHSCRQDLQVYRSGELTNPGLLRGKYSFSAQKVVALADTETVAVARFGISPKLGSLNTLDSYLTLQSDRWVVCLSVTKRADL